MSRDTELSYESTRSFSDWRSCTQPVTHINSNKGQASLVGEDEAPVLLAEFKHICLDLALQCSECQ